MDTLFSGMQPTGSMHVGNYLGAIESWVDLQERYRCVYCIVDYHALTGQVEAGAMQPTILEMATWLLACGIDPAKSLLFVQSDVPEHTELGWILSTVTPMGELSRMTQFKEKSKQAELASFVNTGLYTYPILQAADIMLYKAKWVPVGEDQRQHLELTREITRKFNARYGDTFPECQPLIKDDKRARVLGLDGEAKMSKSLDNHLAFTHTADEIKHRVTRTMVSDTQRARLADPGRPEVCNVFTFHGFFSGTEQRADIEAKCRTAQIGCFHCKSALAENVNARLGPIRERAEVLRKRPDDVRDVLRDCGLQVRALAQVTMDEVRSRVGLR